MNRRTAIWVGVLVAPLPVAIPVLAGLILTGDLRESGVFLLLVAYLSVLVPLVIAYVISRWRGWQGAWRHMGLMFAVTFVVSALTLLTLDVSPDSKITLTFDDGTVQNVPIPLIGLTIALLIAAINALCMAVFWRIAVRACQDSQTSTEASE